MRGQRAERVGRKLTQWRTERISVRRREVTGAEEVAQALSLKLFSWELPGGCGAMAQYLQDLVVTVSEPYFLCLQHNQVYT